MNFQKDTRWSWFQEDSYESFIKEVVPEMYFKKCINLQGEEGCNAKDKKAETNHKKLSNFFLKFKDVKNSGYSSNILSIDLGFFG